MSDTDHMLMNVIEQLAMLASPGVVYRPKVSIDGNQWCALYGENLMTGVAGFGDTPADAVADFNKQWLSCKPPKLHTGED